jgi:hypothetical protein
LPDRTLSQILGGLLLTHFRSIHPRGRISLLREYALGAVSKGRADFVLYDEDMRKPVAVFELVRSKEAIQTTRNTLYKFLATTQSPLILGVLMPESIASASVRNYLKKEKVELVTYPA